MQKSMKTEKSLKLFLLKLCFLSIIWFFSVSESRFPSFSSSLKSGFQEPYSPLDYDPESNMADEISPAEQSGSDNFEDKLKFSNEVCNFEKLKGGKVNRTKGLLR